jgi:hypothetical protein
MAQNPLQQHFRQPRIYIGLPSHGVYNEPGTIQGDAERLPVYGMTGMDEILLKTPDALLSGESTARVIESCIPGITNAWDLSTLDVDLIFTAIRIATYGKDLEIGHTCPECSTENEYTIDLNTMIDHYSKCVYDSKLVLKDLVIVTRPLTYKQTTDFSIQNFQYQQQLKNIETLADDAEKKTALNDVFQKLAELRNAVYSAGIDRIEITNGLKVEERAFITEWLDNCDRDITEEIAKHIEKNQTTRSTPDHKCVCTNCGTENLVTVNLDQSNFFAIA